MSDILHMVHLADVQKHDANMLTFKEGHYRGSWKKRGGVGAFFVLARKWDALENLIDTKFGYDILNKRIWEEQGDGSVLDQIRDLRGYLTLVECEIRRAADCHQSEKPTAPPPTAPPPTNHMTGYDRASGPDRTVITHVARVPRRFEFTGDPETDGQPDLKTGAFYDYVSEGTTMVLLSLGVGQGSRWVLKSLLREGE